MNFTVGQTVLFTQPLFHKGQGLVEGTVTKVGRKFVYIKSFREFQFDIQTLHEVKDSNYLGRIYESREQYENEQEHTDNMLKIYRFFSNRMAGITLDQSRRILAIINEGRTYNDKNI